MPSALLRLEAGRICHFLSDVLSAVHFFALLGEAEVRAGVLLRASVPARLSQQTNWLLHSTAMLSSARHHDAGDACRDHEKILYFLEG